jgi:ribosomal protein S12 methylthiotransferase accessory factor
MASRWGWGEERNVMQASGVMRLVSPYVGPVRRVRELATPTGHAPLPAFMAETADLRRIHGTGIRTLTGGAMHYDRAAAVAAAVGETTERYCAAAVPADLVLAAAEDLGAAAVAPRRFILFHALQYARPRFPFRPFFENIKVRWTRGAEVSTSAPAYLPAQLVYLMADGSEPSADTPIGYATSSGTACAPSADEAVLSALLELVERDAVMIAWYTRWSPRRLEWRGDPHLAAVERRYFASTGLQYLCLDLTEIHGIPTVLSVVQGRDVGLAVGAASAWRPQDAWLKAMREAFATFAWADRLRQISPPIPPGRLHLVETFADHIRFYADPANRRLASFLWQNAESREIKELPCSTGTPLRQVEAITQKLGEIGARAYAVDLTTPDVRRAGVQVWKTISPELQPLDVGYGRRFLGATRLHAMAARLTGRDVSSPADLNHWPHPFP